jgi:hypothetical protein
MVLVMLPLLLLLLLLGVVVLPRLPRAAGLPVLPR